jgi:SAM-dependent methyltransferase
VRHPDLETGITSQGRPKRLRDRHWLYEASVQCPEADIRFFDRVYQEWNGHKPRLLREDFCGTAAIAAEWVRTRPDNIALGIDLDRPTLEWGRREHVLPLGAAAVRVRLLEADVRLVRRPRVDVIAALNFSYFVFHTREELKAYFRTARAALRPGGVFVLDIFGGWESQALVTETKRKPGFTYIWEQRSFDPITHRTRFYIHFRLRDGTMIKRAFTYDWRLWSVPEVREVLLEAGFRTSRVYWEGTDRRTGGGNSVFRATEATESVPGWIGYIAAR